MVDWVCGHYWQKCYDPDCRGHRGGTRSLPMDVMVELAQDAEEEEAAAVVEESDDFLRAIDELEASAIMVSSQDGFLL